MRIAVPVHKGMMEDARTPLGMKGLCRLITVQALRLDGDRSEVLEALSAMQCDPALFAMLDDIREAQQECRRLNEHPGWWVDMDGTVCWYGQEAGRLDATPFVTHRFDLSDVEEAYDVFANAATTEALKVVLSAEPVALAPPVLAEAVELVG